VAIDNEQYQRMARAVMWPDQHLLDECARGTYFDGCTEPWIVEIVAALMKACDAKVVFEGGGYIGTTSAWLATQLGRMGGGKLIIAELEAERAEATNWRLSNTDAPNVEWHVVHDDVFNVIAAQPDDSIDFAWIDDCHEHKHVDAELTALTPKMKRGGIITGHDVHGSCALWMEFEKHGGYALELPRWGAAGGIGILQCR
jgi:predicted O-methyltransferase YrrM